MTATKHTPGPWEAGACAVLGPDGVALALGQAGNVGTEVNDANLMLMAVAPALKEVAERLVAWCGSSDEASDYAASSDLENIAHLARAALMECGAEGGAAT